MKIGVDYPTWYTEASLATVMEGYTLPGETPNSMYRRISVAAARRLNEPALADKFYEYMLKGWLCPSSPVLANMGTTRGLPISCFGITMGDSIDDIYGGIHEFAMMSKFGGGVGVCMNRVRHRNAPITGNGRAEGIVPWAKVLDAATVATKQGMVRKGASSVNLNVRHKDFGEFIRMRRATGDLNRMCQNINHCVQITDEFMQSVRDGSEEDRKTWLEILKTRMETGEPYLHFIDTTNKLNPPMYEKHGLSVEMTNICSEITLCTDLLHSFVCCLSSLNLRYFEDWRDTDLVETAIYFLDAIMSDFIERGRALPGFERSVRFAEKSRALGLGVLGYHSFLQSKGIPLESFAARIQNKAIFKTIEAKARAASEDLAKKYGEPEWCKGFGIRNTHRLAVAPTFSNSIISGSSSEGTIPIRANCFNLKTAKGTFVVKNPYLAKLLEEKGYNDSNIWSQIMEDDGSVMSLPDSVLSEEQKQVFATAMEINQMELIEQGADRQKYIDQSQSLNLFFRADADTRYVHRVHFSAWEKGLKTLYYVRSTSILKGDKASRVQAIEQKALSSDDSCKACEG